MPIAASHDLDSPPDPCARRASANSRRTAFTPPHPTPESQEVLTTLSTARPEVSEPCPRQPPPTGQSQPQSRPPSAKSVLESPQSATPQLPTPASPSTRLPLQSPVTIPRQLLPTDARPTTEVPLLTPEVVLALETPPQSATRPAQLTLSRLSRATPAGVPEGGSSGPASNPEPPPPPPRTASTTPAEKGQPREEVPEDCCECYEALAVPMVHLGSCPHRPHLPWYAALRTRAATYLCCPVCRATVTVEKAGGISLQ